MIEVRFTNLKKRTNVLLSLFIELIKIIHEDFKWFNSTIISFLRYFRVFILFLEINNILLIDFAIEGIYNIFHNLNLIRGYNKVVPQTIHQFNQLISPALPGYQEQVLKFLQIIKNKILKLFQIIKNKILKLLQIIKKQFLQIMIYY